MNYGRPSSAAVPGGVEDSRLRDAGEGREEVDLVVSGLVAFGGTELKD